MYSYCVFGNGALLSHLRSWIPSERRTNGAIGLSSFAALSLYVSMEDKLDMVAALWTAAAQAPLYTYKQEQSEMDIYIHS